MSLDAIDSEHLTNKLMSPLKIRFVQIQKINRYKYIPTNEISRLKQNFFGSYNYYVATSNKSEL